MFSLSLSADPYPQQRDWQGKTWSQKMWWYLGYWVLKKPAVWTIVQRNFIKRVHARQREWETLDHFQLDHIIADVSYRLRKHGLDGNGLVDAFAIVCICSKHALGIEPYDVQLRAAYVITQGFLIEMATGEGKTLTASFAATVLALSGRQLHVVTVNDYLASRDCRLMQPLVVRLGLSSGVVTEDMPLSERFAVYQHNIVYCTGKTLVFDYLRDRMSMKERISPEMLALDALLQVDKHRLLLRGLQAIVVDEVDSVLIDEAKTPLVISREVNSQDEALFLRQAMTLAKQLEINRDIMAYGTLGKYDLTDVGREKLKALSMGLGSLWQGSSRREEVVLQAITALYNFQKDVHYIVRDDNVMIVDENTGRVMADRSWEKGLHQLIEIKEDVSISPPKETLAKISFQLFFRRFLQLSGMSGTCRELTNEFEGIYGVGVVSIPTRLPTKRKKLGVHVCLNQVDQLDATVRRIASINVLGRPTLVGTRSVAASEAISRLLNLKGIAHDVLNAKQDYEEAAIVERAGELGRITIATNMAGRGTDIKLSDEVIRTGGLHVIIVEGNDNLRIDRQLIGRAARQGEPGSWEAILSLDDDLIKGMNENVTHVFKFALSLAPNNVLLQLIMRRYYRVAQRKREKQHYQMRLALSHSDEQMRRMLSFSGQME